jgi:hypothetical protein
MSVRRAISFTIIATALLATLVRAQPQAPSGGGACFFSRNFQQWRSPDPNTILIRVGVNRFYRLDLAAPCRALQFPDAHLITVFRGSDSVCSPLDWDLRVAQSPAGITEQCIVRSMTQMTPEQVASIPPRFRP